MLYCHSTTISTTQQQSTCYVNLNPVVEAEFKQNEQTITNNIQVFAEAISAATRIYPLNPIVAKGMLQVSFFFTIHSTKLNYQCNTVHNTTTRVVRIILYF